MFQEALHPFAAMILDKFQADTGLNALICHFYQSMTRDELSLIFYTAVYNGKRLHQGQLPYTDADVIKSLDWCLFKDRMWLLILSDLVLLKNAVKYKNQMRFYEHSDQAGNGGVWICVKCKEY